METRNKLIKAEAEKSFWRYAIVDNSVFGGLDEADPRYKAIEGLLSGRNIHSLNLEIIRKNPAIYSVRVNKKHRMLFTPIKVGDKIGAYFFHDDARHKYDYKGAVDLLIQQNQDDIELLVRNAFAEKQSVPLLPAPPIELYKDNWLILDDEQQSVLSATLPLVVSGQPGSGKTSSAWSLFVQLAERQEHEEKKTLLYVAQNKKLVKEMADAWKKHLAGNDMPMHEVEFKSYNELVQEDPAVKDFRIAGVAEFAAWLAEPEKKRMLLHIFKEKYSHSINKPASEFFKNANLLYKEFRVLAGMENYEKGFEKHTLFSKDIYGACHGFIAECYQKYTSDLRLRKQVDPAFHSFSIQKSYDGIVGDELQDMTSLQIRALLNITSNVCFTLDPRQSLDDSGAQEERLLALLRKQIGSEPPHIKLSYNYRCHPQIQALANRIDAMKNYLRGQTEKHAASNSMRQSENEEPHICMITNTAEMSVVLAELKERIERSPDYIVVTDEAHKEEAITLFGERVLTAAEIKGLESRKVIYYKPFANNLYAEANSLLVDADLSFRKGRHKRGEKRPQFNDIAKEFVGITRAMDQVIIIQPLPKTKKTKAHGLEHVFTALQLEDYPAWLLPESSAQATVEEWFAQFKKFMLNDNFEQARGIRMRYIPEELVLDEVIECLRAGNEELAKKYFATLAVKNEQAQFAELRLRHTETNALVEPVSVIPVLIKKKKRKPKRKKKSGATLAAIVDSASAKEKIAGPATQKDDVIEMKPAFVSSSARVQAKLIKSVSVPKEKRSVKEPFLLSAKDKRLRYEILNAPTSKRRQMLQKIFYHDNAEAILFSRMEDGQSLFFKILINTEYYSYLMSMLKESEATRTKLLNLVLRESADGERHINEIHSDYSPVICFYALARHEVFVGEQAKQIYAAIPPSLFHKKLSNFESNGCDASFLHLMMYMKVKDTKFVNEMISANPALFTQVTPRVFFIPDHLAFREKDEVERFNASVFELGIARMPAAAAMMIFVNGSLQKHMTKNYLFTNVAYLTQPKSDYFTCFLAFCHLSQGRKVLRMLLELKPALFESITPEQLCTQVSIKDKRTMSALSGLLFAPEGCDLLCRIFEKNPRLAAAIPESEWIRFVSDQTCHPYSKEHFVVDGEIAKYLPASVSSALTSTAQFALRKALDLYGQYAPLPPGNVKRQKIDQQENVQFDNSNDPGNPSSSIKM